MKRKSFLRALGVLFGAIIIKPKLIIEETIAPEIMAIELPEYVAPFIVMSRQSLKNIQFLQNWLPTSLMAEMNKSEFNNFENNDLCLK